MNTSALLSAQTILIFVGAVLLVLVLKDLVRERRLTTAAKVRLLVVAIFAVVVIWNHWRAAP